MWIYDGRCCRHKALVPKRRRSEDLNIEINAFTTNEVSVVNSYDGKQLYVVSLGAQQIRRKYPCLL